MASTNIDEIFCQIEKDFIEISKKAAREAATKAQKDVKVKAARFIREYYKDYTPKQYKRTHALFKLVENVYEESSSGNGIMIEFGVEYNPSNITGVHKSNSWYRQSGTHWIPRLSGEFDFDSQNNGIPEAEWITKNFLEGIHPSGKIGDSGAHYGEAPDKKMQEFFDKELDNKVNAYMQEALWRAINTYF